VAAQRALELPVRMGIAIGEAELLAWPSWAAWTGRGICVEWSKMIHNESGG
jgi:hypothetical protein